MSTNPSRPVAANKDADKILPPPTPLNPIPTLSVALRIDNRDLLLTLLQSIPGKQLLIFSCNSLRTLLMRQVLSDPHTRVFKGKKNWDSDSYFPLPTGLAGSQIAGTKVFPQNLSLQNAHLASTTTEQWDDSIDVATYFLRPSVLSDTIHLSHRIRNCKSSRTHHRVVYLPQATAMCHKILSNLGIHSLPNVTVHRLQLDLFPLETDLFSMEYHDAIRESEVEGTPSSLISTVARSLLKIQDVVGTIPRIQALGTLGEEVLKKMISIKFEEHLAGNSFTKVSEEATAMIIFDRKVDMITPMATPLTYEGLLDEVLGIDCGFMDINVQMINPDDTEAEQVALGVNGSDKLYFEVRDQHVEKFGSFLQNQAKALQQSHADFTSKETKKDLDEIHQFVKQIPIFTKNLRSLTNHIHLAELVKAHSEQSTFRERWQMERSMMEGESCFDTLDELISTQSPLLVVLQSLALQSLTAGGIKSSRYDSLRRDIVQTYGYEAMFVLQALEKAGLIRRREWMDAASTNFGNLRKSLILINAEIDPVDPDDVSYVSSGYAPLSIRLIQMAMKGWKNRDEIWKDLPGRLVDVLQTNPPQDVSTLLQRQKPLPSLGSVIGSESSGSKKPTLIVVFVGGITYMEIASLRFLSKRASFPYHILMVTTKIINGSTLITSLASSELKLRQ
jgi:vacuolar protein sorting-associated protein 33A